MKGLLLRIAVLMVVLVSVMVAREGGDAIDYRAMLVLGLVLVMAGAAVLRNRKR